jgi:hypothetical protein
MLDRVTIRSAEDFGELAAHPERVREANSATVVAATGSVVTSLAMWKELSRMPGAPAALVDFTEALLEKEYEYAMAILDEDDTGIKNNMWFVPVPEGQQGPRLEVAIDPANAVRRGGLMATVPFDPTRKAEGPIPKALERDVREFIELNRLVLMRYWNLEYSSTKKFTADLQPLPKRR